MRKRLRWALCAALILLGAVQSRRADAAAKIWLPKACRALFVGAIQGNPRKIRRALARGADPNCHDASAGTTALMAAVTNGPLAAVEPLLNKGADPNAQDSFGSTALMFAAMLGHDDVVEALLRKGADAGLKTKDGRTALDLATDKETVDVSMTARNGRKFAQYRVSGMARVVQILKRQKPK